MSAPTRAARMVTTPQLRKLHALYRDLGITDRDERIAEIRWFTDQPRLDSSKDLTQDEATSLIDHLERRLAA